MGADDLSRSRHGHGTTWPASAMRRTAGTDRRNLPDIAPWEACSAAKIGSGWAASTWPYTCAARVAQPGRQADRDHRAPTPCVRHPERDSAHERHAGAPSSAPTKAICPSSTISCAAAASPCHRCDLRQRRRRKRAGHYRVHPAWQRQTSSSSVRAIPISASVSDPQRGQLARLVAMCVRRVAVAPIVSGKALKGKPPDDARDGAAGDASNDRRHYDGLLDSFIPSTWRTPRQPIMFACLPS